MICDDKYSMSWKLRALIPGFYQELGDRKETVTKIWEISQDNGDLFSHDEIVTMVAENTGLHPELVLAGVESL